MDPRTLATPNPPDTPAWEELGRLLDRRGELTARVDDLGRQQGAANEAARSAAAAVADAERAALAGEDAPADTKRLDAALAKARARANEPWPERHAGAQRALADHDSAIQRFVVARYADLQDGLREQGEAARAAVDHAAGQLVAAHAAWEAIAGRMSALASSIAPVRPGDWTRSRSERAASEAARLLDNGGELTPDVRDPRKPRYSEPAEDDDAVVVA
jgi:hypothetical protein